jgi:hypothetical protein
MVIMLHEGAGTLEGTEVNGRPLRRFNARLEDTTTEDVAIAAGRSYAPHR